MKFNIAIAALILSCSLQTVGQTIEEPGKDFKREIGISTQFLQGIFNYNPSIPYSFMYKKYSKEDVAWRFGLTANLNLTNDDGSSLLSNGSNNVINSASVFINIGKEKQNKITEKWIWYYGGDIIPSYSFYKNEYYFSSPKVLASTYNSNSWGLGARPFIGLRFNINPRLYVSSEFSINLNFNSGTTTTEILVPASQTATSSQEIKNLSLGYTPASAIFAFYRF